MVKKNKFSIGLTFVRVFICFIIIKNMCFYLPMAEDYFGINAVFPYENYMEQMQFYGLKFIAFPFHLPFLSQIYILIIIVLSTLYMLAIGRRLTGTLLYVGIIILKIRNGFILDGSDNVIQVILPFVVLADNLEHFRYFNMKPNIISKALSNYSMIFTYALMVQVCFVYLFTALAKHEGELWRNGTAIYYTMRVRDFMATGWNIPLTKNHYFVVFTTYFTLFWEMAFPFLIWFRKTKFYIMLGGVMLHVGIWIFMRIDNFSWVMLTTYFVFITDEEYSRAYKAIVNWKLRLFIDGWCPICRKFGERVKKYDLLNLIILEDIRTSKITDEEFKLNSLESMGSINNLGGIFYGFNSIFQIFLRIPLGWIFLPVLFILKLSKLGNWFYSEFAIKRPIVPIHCNENCKMNN